jgi:hypothetical protein
MKFKASDKYRTAPNFQRGKYEASVFSQLFGYNSLNLHELAIDTKGAQKLVLFYEAAEIL